MENKTYELTHIQDGKETTETVNASSLTTAAMYGEEILMLEVIKIQQKV